MQSQGREEKGAKQRKSPLVAFQLFVQLLWLSLSCAKIKTLTAGSQTRCDFLSREPGQTANTKKCSAGRSANYDIPFLVEEPCPFCHDPLSAAHTPPEMRVSMKNDRKCKEMILQVTNLVACGPVVEKPVAP